MINVGRLVTDPKFCTKFTIVTKTGTWEKGAFVTTETEKIVTGVAVPVSGKALEMVPEADRLKDYMTFYSKTTNPLTISSDGTISDSVIYEGKRYKLINGQNFSKQGFWKAMGINEDGK
jgi:hypothetical protein